MKKLLSIVLAVVMMFSISMIAFAADSTSIELDKEYTVTLKADEANYTFIAPEDGAYVISASLKANDDDFGFATVSVGDEDNIVSSIYLYYINGLEDEDGLFDVAELNDKDLFMAKKDAPLTVSVNTSFPYVEDDSIEYSDTTVTFKITSVNDLREIKIGESYTVLGDEYFIFKPTEDGIADIWSHQCQSISIMDTDGNIYYGDKDFLTGFPADVAFEYEAGKIYGVYVESDYNDEGESIDSIFHVVDAKTVRPDVIEMDDITVIWGQDEFLWADIYPLGSIYNCGEFEYSIENEKIATVEYDSESESYVIHGRRPGKTTLTVTEPNYGVTRTVEVEVITRTTNFFRTIFAFVSGIFSFIFGR